jgi:hypothetical protein
LKIDWTVVQHGTTRWQITKSFGTIGTNYVYGSLTIDMLLVSTPVRTKLEFVVSWFRNTLGDARHSRTDVPALWGFLAVLVSVAVLSAAIRFHERDTNSATADYKTSLGLLAQVDVSSARAP